MTVSRPKTVCWAGATVGVAPPVGADWLGAAALGADGLVVACGWGCASRHAVSAKATTAVLAAIAIRCARFGRLSKLVLVMEERSRKPRPQG